MYEDIIGEICHHLEIKTLLITKLINKSFNKVSQVRLNDIIDGKVDPNEIFNMINYNNDDFNYPIDSFFDNEGEWTINHHPSTPEMLKQCKNLIQFTSIYYYQVGENDEASWIIIGKSGEYYIYFEASCDYTGFDCQGGGEFNYDKDWNKLWTYKFSDCHRKLMLKHYGYDMIRLNELKL